eukprot:CAMPEP_0172735244 /NCGR_PEP_ID=MMETSP1074-20121228/112052_1 /TAXON_ID=2916 /ORGANISM="Ceratium fusus, Strain PA161109" /LENGTH=63 /DNA_ID=CAMNT_0013564207 /DNA_START=18 /DNA_END=209 /DNA_ORIENTATION=-
MSAQSAQGGAAFFMYGAALSWRFVIPWLTLVLICFMYGEAASCALAKCGAAFVLASLAFFFVK